MLSEERSAKVRTGQGRRGRGLSDYGRRMLEKQKVRFMYGVTEGQLSHYAKTARERKGTQPNANFFQQLESRLDNAVYRMGFASTRRLARQLVVHGHITLNGRKTNIPSAQIKAGDTIAVRPNSREKGVFASVADRLKEHHVPAWFKVDPKELSGTVTAIPTLVESDVPFDLSLVLELYSR